MDRGMTIIHLISIFCSYSFNLPGVFLSLSLSQLIIGVVYFCPLNMIIKGYFSVKRC